MSTRAVIYPKSAQLTGEFGRDYAMRIFGLDETALEKLVGRYSRGPRKGMLRGVIVWHSVKSGGWVKTGRYDFDSMQGSGFVAKPGVRFGHSILDAKGKPVAGYPGDDIAGAYRWTIDARRSDTVMHSAAEAFDERNARQMREAAEWLAANPNPAAEA